MKCPNCKIELNLGLVEVRIEETKFCDIVITGEGFELEETESFEPLKIVVCKNCGEEIGEYNTQLLRNILG